MSLESRLHHAIVAAILTRGHAPDAEELAAALDVPPADVLAALARLAEDHGLVLHPDRRRVWVIHPFALSPSPVWVAVRSRGFWAPCLWCGFGVATLAGGDAELYARLGGEATPLVLRARDGRPAETSAVLHVSIPPRGAWDSVIHWCATVQPFANEADVDGWCAHHGLPRGAVVPMAQIAALARRWYGGHAAPDWRKHTASEAQAIFAEVGLVGPFWEVPSGEGRF